jgi:tetratricopeptide (TPR) repeat protein
MAKQISAAPHESVTAPDPQTAEEFTQSGWDHYSKKEYYRAEADFQKALELSPDNIDTLYVLALTLQSSGRQQEAIHTFEKVIKELKQSETVEKVRAHMLVRLAQGHINRIKTGDWNLSG